MCSITANQQLQILVTFFPQVGIQGGLTISSTFNMYCKNDEKPSSDKMSDFWENNFFLNRTVFRTSPIIDIDVVRCTTLTYDDPWNNI